MDLPVAIQRHMNHGVAQPAASQAGAGGVALLFPPLHQLQSGATQRSDTHPGRQERNIQRAYFEYRREREGRESQIIFVVFLAALYFPPILYPHHLFIGTGLLFSAVQGS